MKKLSLAATVLSLCFLSFAQTPSAGRINTQLKAAGLSAQKSAAQPTLHRNPSSADCVFIFTSGTKNTFLKYCVTATGNVTVFESPRRHEHSAVGVDGEGYGICGSTSGVAYFDYAERGDSGNWGLPTVVSHNATSVTIARTTSDGLWTLTQTFTHVAGPSPSARITMTLRNNTAVDTTAILLRYADVDASGVSLNNLDATLESAFGWNSTVANTRFGLVLQTVGNPPRRYSRRVSTGRSRWTGPVQPLLARSCWTGDRHRRIDWHALRTRDSPRYVEDGNGQVQGLLVRSQR